VDVQDPGEGQAAEAGADDGDRVVAGVHGFPRSVRGAPGICPGIKYGSVFHKQYGTPIHDVSK
jgi:hypothetical protein